MDRYAWLTLYRALTRHRVYALVNIGGLALGIAVFLVLALFVRFETSFERWLPHYREIYRVQTELRVAGSPLNGAYPGTMAGLLEQLRADFPGTVGTRIRGGREGGSVLRGDRAVRDDVAQVDASFPDVFALPMLRGDARRALADPGAALISRAAARRYFGTADPVGQALTVAVDAPALYRVVGVFEDLPTNTDLRFSILLPLPATPPPAEWMWYRWGSAGVETYLRFPDAAAADRYAAALPAFVRRRAGHDLGPDPAAVIALPLLPLARAHLQPSGPQSAGRRLKVIALGSVGVLALLVAIVNYLNLATARVHLRAREVAMRKVLGADRAALLRQFLGEAVATAAAAALLGLILAELALPFVNAAGGTALTIPYALVVPGLAFLALGVGLGAGLYPAVLMARHPAARALAGTRAPGGARGGTRLREALVVVQFTAAIALVAGTLVLAAQTAHLRAADLGYRRDGLLIVTSLAEKSVSAERAAAVLAALRRVPGITAVGVGSVGPGDAGAASVDAITLRGRPGPGATALAVSVGPGFFAAYAPRLLAGRLLDDAHGADDSTDWTRWAQGRNVVINRAAVAALGFASPAAAVGRTVGDGRFTIVGVIDRLRFFSPRTPESATYYAYYRSLPPTPIVALRAADAVAATAAVRAAWRRVAPDLPLALARADRRVADLQVEDEQATRLFAGGAVLAVLIGCVGLSGLAAFTAARRVREIGVRKVLGAASGDVARLLIGQFLRPVLLANLLAWPLAYVALRRWLAGFADRVALSPLYFVAAGALALAVALLAVAAQSLRASRSPPGWALRHD